MQAFLPHRGALALDTVRLRLHGIPNHPQVGLGTGSTAYFAVERLGQKLASGELTNIIAGACAPHPGPATAPDSAGTHLIAPRAGVHVDVAVPIRAHLLRGLRAWQCPLRSEPKSKPNRSASRSPHSTKR